MPKYKIEFSFLQGVDHHHPDYLMPDAPFERVHRTRTVDAANEKEAGKELWRLEGYSHGGEIESIKDIKDK